MFEQIGSKLFAIGGFSVLFSLIFIPSVHFALKKKGGVITGYKKKISLGLLASLIWTLCFVVTANLSRRGGILSQLSSTEAMFNLLLTVAFFTIIPLVIFAFAMERIGPKWSVEEEMDKKYWRGIAVGVFLRFWGVWALLAILAAMFKGSM